MKTGVFQGYEPGGFPLPGRNYSSGSYRHLFQGQLHDDEIYGGVGTSYAFEYRMHDSRVGRFWSIDPLAGKYAYNSPYAFSENRLIDGRELEGLEWEKVTGYAAFEWGFDLNFNDDVTYIKGFVERKANQFSAAMKAEKDAFIKEMARNPSVLLLAAPLVAIVGPELAAAAGTESLVAGAGVQTVDVASEFTQQWVQTGFDVGQVDYIDVGGAAAPWALEQAIGGAADYKPDVGFKFVGGQGDYFKDPRAAGVEMFLGGAQNRLTNSLFNPKLVGKGLFPTVTEKKFDFITGASEKVIEDEIKESAGFEKK
jgi:hypothetical protein